MATNNAWNSPAFPAYEAHNFTGVEAWGGAGVYYSVAGTNFTVERGGTGYIKTTPITWAGGQTVAALSAGDTHYVYMDTAGTIGSTTTRNLALFEDNINLFEVLVDNDGPANLISTATGNFDHILSSADTNVQIALETIDESGVVWAEVTGTTQAAGTNWGYITNNGALVTVTLPATCALGKRVRISGKGAGGWRVAQNAGQTIYFGSDATTTGAGGRLDSNNQRDAVDLVCITADTDFNVISSIGNITVT